MGQLTVAHLKKSYKKRQVVQDVSLSIQSGQVVGLLGPNGAGKTTSFYMIVGLVVPDAGNIRLNDVDITYLPVHQRARHGLSYLPQEMLHISHLAKHDALALSGGERRRVEIARALATQPKFILLDEPFAGVDPIAVQDIQQIILFLKNKNVGVLITDHNVRETLGICDHAYIISQGRVLADGTPQDIAQNDIVKDVYLGKDFTLNF